MLQLVCDVYTCDQDMCPHFHHTLWDMFTISFQLWFPFIQLIRPLMCCDRTTGHRTMELRCFCTWFGYALLSFTAGMHGGYFWKIKEFHRMWGRRRGIMDRGGAAIMIWGGWECMATEELAIKRLGGKFWSGRFSEFEGESCRGGSSEESLLWRRTKADCARGFQKCVDRGVDLFAGGRLDWLQTFSTTPVASQISCYSHQEA